jgi:hypothetical protein
MPLLPFVIIAFLVLLFAFAWITIRLLANIRSGKILSPALLLAFLSCLCVLSSLCWVILAVVAGLGHSAEPFKFTLPCFVGSVFLIVIVPFVVGLRLLGKRKKD